ncbi:CIA30 family protein [Oscillatoria sp. FACHB-1406]|uniref:CIA30 family protein n=1 Tax=Oscillatoria sp. FACHB-1406 TaxID=2692846 RepID=UPI0016829F34|nr:CIA30 family protein [Oscillatoria sp. FACHB-1406]MBD2580584.1 CIA30 family protein [Oscillatoria sp. FACHB-1406]
MTQRQNWNPGRFLKTVTFFELFPFLNLIPCLKTMILGRQPQPTSPFSNSRVGTILVVGETEELNAQIVKHLRAKNYPVRVLTSELAGIESRANSEAEYYRGSLQDKASFSAELMAGVQTMIASSVDASAMDNLVQVATRSLGTDPTTTTLFDFRQPTADLAAIWGAVDDVVMGGVSESNLRFVNDCAVFAGNVSVANSGGFASVRNRNFSPPLDLSSYEGIQLRVKGDGQRYKFILRCEGKWDGVSYCYSFNTAPNNWIDVRIPFDELIPTFRAKTVNDAPKFDSSKTYSMQLMLSKFEYDGNLNPRFVPGVFELQWESIQAYGKTAVPKLIYVSLGDEGLERQVLESGVSYAIIRGENTTSEEISRRCVQAVNSPRESVN